MTGEQAPRSDEEYLDVATYAWIARVYRRIHVDQARHLATYGITPQQLGAMMFLLRAGRPMRFAELATCSAIKGSTLTGIIDGLERRGLALRLPQSGDRRQVLIELTQSGCEALRSVPPIDHEGVLASALREIGQQKSAELLQLLTELGSKFGDSDYPELVNEFLRFRQARGEDNAQTVIARSEN